MARDVVVRPRGREGLTLVEVVIAVGILSLILLGTFGAMATAQRTDLLTRERMAAAEACYNALDTILTGEVPAAGASVSFQFPVAFKSGRDTLTPLRPAFAYPTDLWTWASVAPPAPITLAGVAVAKVGVNATNPDANDAGNVDLMEARVMVAWRAADGTDQRFEARARRVR
ncbi:MAG: prepilin-type N-terminal cleavage/methylation domain-containing protein [Planctomycetes bacterium]|nr:prepilin-type N-terminal cleavage/methylation domain-containing protein [Planctomycetota bacterium]